MNFIKKSKKYHLFSLPILSFSKKTITLQPHLVLPLIDIIYEATELRWERSENLRHYPML